MFDGTNINISCSGHSYLGSPIGLHSCFSLTTSCLRRQWSDEIHVHLLTAIALTQPHAAFAAFTHGLSSKWSYLSCTTADLSLLLRFNMIPALTGNPAPDTTDRQLFALPAREGGLGIIHPASSCDLETLTQEPSLSPSLRQFCNAQSIHTLVRLTN